MTEHRVGTREQWLAARRALLEREKESTRRSDELARQRQELPWVEVKEQYAFATRDGTKTLAQHFDGRSQCGSPARRVSASRTSSWVAPSLRPTFWPPAVTLSPPGDPTDMTPGVTLANDGDAVAGWQRRTGDTGVVEAAEFSAAGGRCPPPNSMPTRMQARGPRCCL